MMLAITSRFYKNDKVFDRDSGNEFFSVVGSIMRHLSELFGYLRHQFSELSLREP